MLVASRSTGVVDPRPATCRTCSLRATSSWSIPRRRCRPRCPHAGRTEAHPAAPVHTGSGQDRSLGGGAALRRRALPVRPAGDARTPGGRTVQLLAPYLSGRRLWVARLELPCPCLPTSPSTAHRSGTATCRERCRFPTTRRSSLSRQGARRCRCGLSLHAQDPHCARRPRNRDRAHRPAHGRVLARGRRGAVPRALPRARGPRAWWRRRGARGGGSSRSARLSCGRSRRPRVQTAASEPPEG